MFALMVGNVNTILLFGKTNDQIDFRKQTPLLKLVHVLRK